MSDDSARGPLSGLVVIDLSRALAGPHAGMMLGDLGARVIKVEQPGGDDTRGWGPPFVDGESTYYLACNRNKESVVLDLRTPEGKERLAELLAVADVLVENFRPGVLDRLGFAPQRLEELNPRLVVLSISGFGHDGPERDRAGYDQIAQGESGLMSVTGSGPGDPQKVGVPIGDLLAGIHGVVGVLAALVERASGDGPGGGVVRTSLLASLVGVLSFQGTRWTIGGDRPRAMGNHHPSIAPYGLFRCRDGAIQIAVGSDALWQRFAPIVGIDPADPRWANNAGRVGGRDELTAAIEAAFAERSREEVLGRLAAAGVPAGRIRTVEEAFASEQTVSQGLALTLEHERLGEITVPGSPLRFFGFDGAERTRASHTAPPVLDADSEGVAAWLASARLPV